MYEEADKDRSEFPDWDGHTNVEEDPGRYVIIGDYIIDCGPSK